jgi:hypothetical protein
MEACDQEEIIEGSGMERPWDLEDSMEEGGIETCDPNSGSSGDGDFLLARTAIDKVAAFSFCDSGDKSVSLRFRRERSGDEINFLRNVTGNFDTAGASSTSSSSSNTSSSSTGNLQPFLALKHRRHFAFPGTTSQSFLTPRQ